MPVAGQRIRYTLLPVEFEYFKPDTKSDQQWQDVSQRMTWGEIYTFDAPWNHPLRFKVRVPGLTLTPSALSAIEIEIARHADDPKHQPTWTKYKLSEIGRISPDQKEVWCIITSNDMRTKVNAPVGGTSIRHASMDWIADASKSSFPTPMFLMIGVKPNQPVISW